LEGQGGDYVVIRRPHSAAGAVISVANIMRTEQAKEPHLAFCPADRTNGSTIIDYRKTTIVETWQSEFYRALRQAHLTNDYACQKFCVQRPGWKATRWPGEGRSYADMVEKFIGTE